MYNNTPIGRTTIIFSKDYNHKLDTYIQQDYVRYSARGIVQSQIISYMENTIYISNLHYRTNVRKEKVKTC